MTWILSALGASIAASLLLVGGGCGRTTPLVVGPDHPASADAVAAPTPAISQTLAITNPPTTPDEADDMADHSGHTMGAAMPPSTQPSPTTQPAGVTADGAFVCPMHPEVTSDDPDARCPKCGMNLVAKEERQ